jgi:hypothetical protein
MIDSHGHYTTEPKRLFEGNARCIFPRLAS